MERLVPDGGKAWIPVTVNGEPIAETAARKARDIEV
jgi:hypothetical protein